MMKDAKRRKKFLVTIFINTQSQDSLLSRQTLTSNHHAGQITLLADARDPPRKLGGCVFRMYPSPSNVLLAYARGPPRKLGGR